MNFLFNFYSQYEVDEGEREGIKDIYVFMTRAPTRLSEQATHNSSYILDDNNMANFKFLLNTECLCVRVEIKVSDFNSAISNFIS
jgi:hypothetical protein